MDDLDLMPTGVVGTSASLLIFGAFLGVGGAFALAVLVARSVALARAQASQDARIASGRLAPLAGGGLRVVEGRVEVEGASDVAVHVDIVQVVRDRSSKGGTWHEWEEVRRSVE